MILKYEHLVEDNTINVSLNVLCKKCIKWMKKLNNGSESKRMYTYFYEFKLEYGAR